MTTEQLIDMFTWKLQILSLRDPRTNSRCCVSKSFFLLRGKDKLKIFYINECEGMIDEKEYSVFKMIFLYLAAPIDRATRRSHEAKLTTGPTMYSSPGQYLIPCIRAKPELSCETKQAELFSTSIMFSRCHIVQVLFNKGFKSSFVWIIFSSHCSQPSHSQGSQEKILLEITEHFASNARARYLWLIIASILLLFYSKPVLFGRWILAQAVSKKSFFTRKKQFPSCRTFASSGIAMFPI